MSFSSSFFWPVFRCNVEDVRGLGQPDAPVPPHDHPKQPAIVFVIGTQQGGRPCSVHGRSEEQQAGLDHEGCCDVRCPVASLHIPAFRAL